MANQSFILTLKRILEGFKLVDLNKVYRESIGEESLKNRFEKIYEKIVQKIEFAISYAPDVRDDAVNQINSIFQNILNRINTQAGMNNQQYIAQKEAFLSEIDAFLSQLQSHWHLFVTAAIEARGLLDNEGFREEYQKTISAVKTESQKAISDARAEATRIIEETKKISGEIEKSARNTAVGISVKDAQKQFGDAQVDLDGKVITWNVISLIMVLAFISSAVCFMKDQHLPDTWTWQVIYYTGIRVTILTALAAITTFCLRTLRAHMHMRELNLHRQRLANSISSFVEAALTPEQRDYILSRLVDAISSFGNSGLIDSGEDLLSQSKMNMPNISVGLTAPK